MGARTTKEQFLSRAREIHRDKYEYDLSGYKSNSSRISIICIVHGTFTQVAQEHLRGCGCKKCAIEYTSKITAGRAAASFVERANNIHCNKYNYDRVRYVNKITRVEIICPIHGSFMQTPTHHLRGSGCQTCANISISNSLIREAKEKFVDRALLIHGEKYLYTNVNYIDSSTKVNIVCKLHGGFMQAPNDHIKGRGCPICGVEQASQIKINNSKMSFAEKANRVHNNKYDYDIETYVGVFEKVKITCKDHGVFYQAATDHLKGRGCSKCSSLGFQQNKPAVLYVLITDGNFIGFGISGDFNKRLRTHRNKLRSHNIEIVDVFLFKGYGENVLDAESYIKRTFANSNVFIEGFKTEAFTNDRLPIVLEYLRSRADLK